MAASNLLGARLIRKFGVQQIENWRAELVEATGIVTNGLLEECCVCSLWGREEKEGLLGIAAA